MEIFKECGVRRYRNALHAQFHSRMYELINEFAESNPDVSLPSRLMTQWKSGLDTEVDLCKETRASAITAELKELDKERTRKLSFFFTHVRYYADAKESEIKKAAAQLLVLVNAYGGLQSEGTEVKTLYIKGFIVDVRALSCATCLETLGLSDELAQIEAANDQYAQLYKQRLDSYTQKMLPEMTKLRPVNDLCYRKICTIIEAAYFCAEDTELGETIFRFIYRANEQIVAMQTLHNQHLAQKKGAGNGDPTLSNDTELPLPPHPTEQDQQSTDQPESPSDTDTPSAEDNTPTGGGVEDTGSGGSPDEGQGGDTGSDTSGDTGGNTPPDTGGFMG